MTQNLLVKSPFFLICKESRRESPASLYASFSLGPFESGQSLTVANALRRTLLSELPGISITSVQIEGVFHEYSSLTGVRESVLDILLNLKEIILKNDIEKDNCSNISVFQNPKLGYLKARGPGIVRGRDLKLPASIKCVNPDQYLFTLCEDGIIDMKFTIHKGKYGIVTKTRIQEQWVALQAKQEQSITTTDLVGPVPEDLSRKQETIISNEEKDSETKDKKKEKTREMADLKNKLIKENPFIELDSLFIPVSQVNYIIEETSFSQHTILLEIWTNGSIYPREALFYAIQYLSKLFSRLEKLRLLDQNFIKTTILDKSRFNSTLFLKYEKQLLG